MVSNGVLDPCPDFESAVAPARKLRREARVALLAGRELTAEQRRGAGGEPHLFQVALPGPLHAGEGIV